MKIQLSINILTGRESDYVILSTVRSMPFDKLERPVSTRWAKEHIGDIADSRMINLAITRTRAALFIFGKEIQGLPYFSDVVIKSWGYL